MASESERDRREALADIASEMRTRSREVKEAFGGRPDGVENMLDIWADRIEAIDSADAWRSLYTPGNAAAMREALNQINCVVWDKKRHTKEETEAHRLATEALTVPARQCDVGTADEQEKRFQDFCDSSQVDEDYTSMCARCTLRRENHCELAWAQTPYAEEGAGK